jgi:hypothetical protein
MAAAELTQPADDPAMSAGSGILMAIGAGVTGMLIGGFRGAAAGVFIAGGVRNSYRAYQFWRSGSNPDEASKSGLVAAVGLAVGGWIGYAALDRGENHHESDRQKRTSSDLR